jgi:FkbM family methyltransferase
MNELERSVMTISCDDCARIPKVQEAGRILDTPDGLVQIMHNGLKVRAGGYYGDWMAHIIRGLRGHHEPQEELAFHHLLKYVRHNSLMVELGAFWSYYTLWYLHDVPNSSAICVEPDPSNIEVGKDNARLNHLEDRIRFHEAWIGAQSLDSLELRCESTNTQRLLPCLDMAAVLDLADNRAIELLHIDAQGAELPFILSMAPLVEQSLVRFIVVSTHHSSISGSPTTHTDCRDALLKLGAVILAEHDVQQSFSGDGLIVASFFSEDQRIQIPHLSLNRPHLSMFPEP